MLVTIEGFGSIWSKRSRPDPRNPRHERAAYYNTTGVRIDDKVQHRTRIFGQVGRFVTNATNSFAGNGLLTQ